MKSEPANIRNYNKLKDDKPFVRATKQAAYLEILANIRFNRYAKPINFEVR
jgi:hypothetical protein